MKKNSKIVIYCVTGAVLLISLTALGYFGFNYFKDKVILNIPVQEKKQKIELKTTELNTKVQEGIYIIDVSEIVENVMPSIVSITSKTLVESGYYGPFSYGRTQEQYVEGAGSGIIIGSTDDEILILTNNHVVSDSKELTVKFINDKDVDATIKGTSERKDVAVISVKTSSLDKDTINEIKVATMGDSKELKVGNGIIAIGNALGYGQSVTTGVVSALNREIESDNYSNKMIQIDAAINGGNSGGALLNSKGEVVGINSAKYSSNGSSTSASIEGMGFAIPITDVKELITDLMNGNEASSGIVLGIEGYMTNNANLIGYNLPEGFYISAITKDGYADKSELEIGYIITEIDGNTVKSVNTIQNVLYDKKKGNSVSLKVKYPKGRSYSEKEIIINF